MGYRAKPNQNKKYFQGQYKVENLDKYLGDPTCVWYRSSWEYKMYRFLDVNPSVLKWNVEGIMIPYQVYENGTLKTKRYYPDCFMRIQNGDTYQDYVLEIKPQSEFEPPKPPKNQTLKSNESFEYRLKTYQKNLIKWEAAVKYCEKRGLIYKIITERYFDDKKIKLF